MKINKKSIMADCPKCKEVVTALYQLDGWGLKDFLCGNCFVEELIEGEYIIDYDKEIR